MPRTVSAKMRWDTVASGKQRIIALTEFRVFEQLSLFGNELPKKMFSGRYWIETCPFNLAMELVVKNHYLHRTCPCSKAYKLTDGEDIVGVVTYGVPCSSTLIRGICGDEEMHNVYELNRLWVRDDVPRNGESFLVGNTLHYLDREIIVSYSDTSVGHVGYIYQATNFLYCGLSKEFFDIRVKGLEGQHNATFANSITYEEIIEKYGLENVYFAERPRKHRYVYFNANRKRKRELMSKLRYEVLPYPKGDSTRHTRDESYGY